jgi:hypothetical protein
MQRCVNVLAESVPRWRKILQAEGSATKLSEATMACADGAMLQGSPLPADDADFFAPPVALSFGVAAAGGDVQLHQRSLEPVGLLACLPGYVSKLAAHQQRQVEIATKLLADTQSVVAGGARRPVQHRSELICSFALHVLYSFELASQFTQISTVFDAVHNVYDLQKQHFSPSHITLWASANSISSLASGTGVNQPASYRKSGKLSGSGAKVSAADEPPANSVANVMTCVEQLERIVNAQ